MNPGYAGRAELPDNLKVLFRTVAMMIPDYAMIAEIMLYSSGYRDARRLSNKITHCLRLASEQLSSQDHYDFGMRNVKAILSAARKLKRERGELEEDTLVLMGIIECNLPKYTTDDVILFKGITSDLFPGTTIRQGSTDELRDLIQKAATAQNLLPAEHFVAKALQIHETTVVRHGMMVVGHHAAGKTTLIHTLRDAHNMRGGKRGEEVEEETADDSAKAITVHCINPKSMPIGNLYGSFDPMTHEWSDGILPVIIRALPSGDSASADTEHHWVIFDGPVDTLWIENMNTVLDDNKKLCLNSGEIIRIGNAITMMFEVDDLSTASPATISRCGMVWVESESDQWKAILHKWVADLPDDTIRESFAKFRNEFESIVEKLREFSRKAKACLGLSESMRIACVVSFGSFSEASLGVLSEARVEMKLTPSPPPPPPPSNPLAAPLWLPYLATLRRGQGEGAC